MLLDVSFRFFEPGWPVLYREISSVFEISPSDCAIVPVTSSNKPHLVGSVIILFVCMCEELQEPCQALVFWPTGLAPEHGTHCHARNFLTKGPPPYSQFLDQGVFLSDFHFLVF